MARNQEEWLLNDIEKEIKKEGDAFVNFLQNILKSDGGSRVIEILKASGYFISFNERQSISVDQKTKVEDFVTKKLSPKNQQLYKNLIKEASFLCEKRFKINSDIEKMLVTGGISKMDVINYVIERIKESNQCVEENNNSIATIEYWIYILGTLLKVMMYSVNEASTNNIAFQGEELDLLMQSTFIYRELNEVIQSWMYGTVEICVDDGILNIKEASGLNQDRIVSALYCWDIRDANQAKVTLSEYERTGNWEERQRGYKELMRRNLKEYFFSEDLLEEYLGIELGKWVNIYTYFAKIAYESPKTIIKFKRETLIKEISKEVCDQSKAEKILNYFTFTKKSTDIFDSFLIAEKEELIFVPSIFLSIDPSRAMISLFGKKDDFDGGLNKKGTSFERHIYELVKETCRENVKGNIKENYQGETYELDLVFMLEDNVFICECKTQYPHENMRGYYRNLRELQYYIKKFQRNFNYFVQGKGKNRLLKELNTNSYANVYPIFISNITYMDTQINNIYITDEAHIFRYMKRIPACVHIIEPNKNICNQIKLFPQFYEGVVSAEQFIMYLNNKTAELNIDRERVKLTKNPTLESIGISSMRYIENKNAQLELLKLVNRNG